MNLQNDVHDPEPFIWTGSRDINILDPNPDDFVVPEIAQSLSRRPRYGGFSDVTVSIAAHTLICDAIYREQVLDAYTHSLSPTQIKNTPLRRAVLIHDWPEAYLSDIQRPLKRTNGFEAYRQLEDVYLERMASRWGAATDDFRRSVVKRIDNLALAAEVHTAMPAVVGQWANLPDPTPGGLEMADYLLNRGRPAPTMEAAMLVARAFDMGIR